MKTIRPVSNVAQSIYSVTPFYATNEVGGEGGGDNGEGDGDNGEGDGGGGNKGEGGGGLEAKLTEALLKFVGKQGGETGALQRLWEDNYAFREKARKAEERAAAFEGKHVVGEDELKMLSLYKNLGEPDEVAAMIKRAEQAERRLLVNDIAGVYGWEKTVLGDLLQGLDVGTEQVNGKLVGYVMMGEEKKPLDTYMQENKAAYMPALVKETGGGGGRYRQHPGGSGESVSAAEAVINRRYAKKK